MSEAITADSTDFEESQTSSKIDDANKIVRKYVMATVVPSVIPLPLVDIALISGIQMKMIHSLCNLYGVKFFKDIGKETTATLIGSVTPVALTPIAMSLIQVIPVIGQASGTIGLLTLSSASTYAVGKVFTQHFETGGTLLTFNAEKVKSYYAEEFEKGKEAVDDIKSGKSDTKASTNKK